jgi:hypothetical protein
MCVWSAFGWWHGVLLAEPQQKSIAAFMGPNRSHWPRRPEKIVFPGTQSESFKIAVGTITTNQANLRSAECSLLTLPSVSLYGVRLSATKT